jgi:uroporphyrinogen decarboxylase
MPGTVKDVEVEVARRILAFGPGGGYSLGCSNHIQEDVPPENVVALFEIAKDLGRYPLDVPRLRRIMENAPDNDGKN